MLYITNTTTNTTTTANYLELMADPLFNHMTDGETVPGVALENARQIFYSEEGISDIVF